ncbi:MAG: lipase secretion chaperone [Leptospiraceae bacterium]|nr:lipase secretion chaperone [Leptospiraceae bacterium]
MNKNILFGIVGVLVLALVAFFLFGKNGKKKKSNTKSDSFALEESGEKNLYPLGNPSGMYDDALVAFSSENKISYSELISGLESGKINFVWEVWAMRKNCPGNYTLDQCNELVLASIDKNYVLPDSENIKKLFSSYFKYEKFIGYEFKSSDSQGFNERYEDIRKERKRVLGEENAKLFFGMEEAQVDFIAASKNFVDSTKNLGGDDRVKKFDELRKKTYGKYHDAIVSREDKFQNYQLELELREKDLSSLSKEEREKKIRSTQERYFGKEVAEKMAKAEKESAEEIAKLEEYKKQEKDFLSANPSMNEKEKSKKLEELRIKLLGKEEAEAYLRRLEVEKLEKNL